MNKKLTFVPASKMGPHYVDAGLRPEEIKGSEYIEVTLQLQDGRRVNGQYFFDVEGFYRNGTWIHHLIICWWHLPQVVPNTEREWFDKSGIEMGYGVYQHVPPIEGKPFVAYLGDYDWPSWEGAPHENADMCINDAYEHWVASGRP